MIEAIVAGVGVLVALNGAVLAYVISIERHLTYHEIGRGRREAIQ